MTDAAATQPPRHERIRYADDKQFIMSLAKGLELLRVFEPELGALGNSELAALCGLPKATVARITYTLVRLGYLEAIPRIEKYRLGAGVLALGHSYLGTQFARSIAAPLLADLALRHDVTAALGVRDRTDIVYIEMAYGRSLGAIRYDIGSRVPLTRSAIGLAYIVSLDPVARSVLKEELKGADRDDWPSTEKRIAAAEREMKEHGFCRLTGLLVRNVAAAGAPVHGLPGAPLMAINVAAPPFGPHDGGISTDIGRDLVMVAETLRQGLARRGESF